MPDAGAGRAPANAAMSSGGVGAAHASQATASSSASGCAAMRATRRGVTQLRTTCARALP